MPTAFPVLSVPFVMLFLKSVFLAAVVLMPTAEDESIPSCLLTNQPVWTLWRACRIQDIIAEHFDQATQRGMNGGNASA